MEWTKGLALAVSAGVVAVVSMTSCTEGLQFTADRTFTSTVAVARETALEVRTVLPITATGVTRLDEVHVTIAATITASTSTRAKTLAAALALTEDHSTPGKLGLLLDAPTDAMISGTMALEAPADLALTIVEAAGTTDVSGFANDLTIASLSHVRITGATRSVIVEVSAGNALIDTAAAAGTQTRIAVSRGDIELVVPEGLSADIQAVTAAGGVYPSHPRLPPFFGGAGQPYQANVGGGLAVIRLQTGAGNIVIRTR